MTATTNIELATINVEGPSMYPPPSFCQFGLFIELASASI